MSAIVMMGSTAPVVEVAGCRATIKVRAEETGGAFGMMEMYVAPSFVGPPILHAHSREDWWGAVHEGEIALEVDGKELHVRAGDVVFVPRGSMFRYWNPKPEPARWTCTYAPGGFENYFLELGAASVREPGAPLGKLALPLWKKYGLDVRQ